MKKPTLRTLELHDFRCFAHIVMRELAKVNILVGPNNVGKTALMTALRRLTRVDERYVPKVGAPDGAFAFGGDHFIKFRPGDVRGTTKPMVTVVVQGPNSASETVVAIPRDVQTESGDINEKNLATIREFASRIVYVPSLRRAPAVLRRHDVTSHEERLYDGSDLLVELLEACVSGQRPNQLDVIEGYVESMLGATAKFKLSVDPPSLGLSVGGAEFRPLVDLGEGISQVVVIAAAVACVAEPLLLLEEPETGLHPALQRKLLDFLVTCPGVQCILSTHSNHVLDIVHPEVAIFRLQTDHEGARCIDRIASSDLATLAELGVRPSSIAATNCVIWVEGPTDAMYIGEWLRRRASDLELWRDYGFSFFGGALLEHTSVDDDNLVRLLRVNPSFYLVADSDRSSSAEPLGKDYLQRVAETLSSDRLWITSGREIESYLSDRLLKVAFGKDPKKLKPGVVRTPGAPIERRLRALGLPKSTRKMLLATKVVSTLHEAAEWPLDLAERIDALANFIRICRDRIPVIDGRCGTSESEFRRDSEEAEYGIGTRESARARA